MNKQSIGILNAIVNYSQFHNEYDKNLVIIYPTGTALMSKSRGPFLSFEDLTSGDFFEIYRYKKGLEESEDKRGND
ncbi:unnamed protein product [marine sediment metagenome]|uniref:Uncharacterized protein n=1 Tax=marine sediment metagenome TaxID=412755 RepID=X1GFN9_9ZZZZ